MKRTFTAAIAALLTTVTLFAAPKFTSVWKAPIAGEVSLAGKKVAALVITNDESLRVAGEEALVRELTSRGLQGVASYKIVPREELTVADLLRRLELEWGNVAGLLAAETPTTITLRMAQGVEQKIGRSDIASMTTSRLSLMPQELEKSMTKQEMADLLAFLKGQ